MITQHHLRDHFAYSDDGRLTRKAKTVGRVPGKSVKGYRMLLVGDTQYLMHRMIFLWHHGYLPEYVDHIDRDRSNNRIENLRAATMSQNAANSAKVLTTKPWKGVAWSNRREHWVARMMFNYREKYIGSFDCPADAAQAYNLAAGQAFGDFACYNGLPDNLAYGVF